MRKSVVAMGALAAAALAGPAAGAHELEGWITEGGVEFLEGAVPSLVPDRFDGIEMQKTLLTCPGGREITANQHDTDIELAVNSLDIDLPADDHVQVTLNFSLSGDGDLDIQNPYACFGSATCTDSFYVNEATAYLDFNVEIEDGKPVLTVYDINLDVDEDDLDVSFADCGALDDVANFVIGFAKDYLLDQGLDLIENMAKQQISPMLSEMMVGFNGVQGDFSKFSFDAQLRETDVSVGGLTVRGDVDVYSKYEPATCIDHDPGEPSPHDGPRPVIDMTRGDIGLAANYGIIDDALYHVWRRGMMCMNEQTVAGYGLDVAPMMDEVAKMLPGFPAGTEFGFDVRMAAPPHVEGSADPEGGLTMHIEGVSVDIIGHRPDGQSGVLHVELDMSMSANLGVDPTRNVMTLSVGQATIDRLAIDDQIASAEAGFDAARIRTVVGDYIMPAMIAEMQDLPLTAPVFGMNGMYIILQQADLGPAFLAVTLDLFQAPAVDDQAPDTRFTSEVPELANPKSAELAFGGNDDKVPAQLLQFVVTVDGEALPPSFVKTATIGEVGVTRSYDVQVAAMDLKGNIDATPVTATVMVDGIAPGVAIHGKQYRKLDGEAAHIAWIATDDYSDASKLSTTLEIYRVDDKRDSLDKQLVETVPVPAGQSEADVTVADGSLYRVEVVVQDEAGNETRTTVTLSTPGMGGCAAGGGASTPMALALSLLALAVVPQRRRRLGAGRR